MGRLLAFLLGLALVALGAAMFSEFMAVTSAAALHGVRPSPIEFLRPAVAIAAGLLGLSFALIAAVVRKRPAAAGPDAPGPAPRPFDSEDPGPFPTDDLVRAFDPEPIADEEETSQSESEPEPRV